MMHSSATRSGLQPALLVHVRPPPRHGETSAAGLALPDTGRRPRRFGAVVVHAVQVCVQERNVFCGEVATGGARVFRCLAHNLAKADFGEACRSEIKAKLMRRQQNWKLDVALRNACKVDAEQHCSDVDHGADKAETARCLISHHSNLTDSCAHEARPPLLTARSNPPIRVMHAAVLILAWWDIPPEFRAYLCSYVRSAVGELVISCSAVSAP